MHAGPAPRPGADGPGRGRATPARWPSSCPLLRAGGVRAVSADRRPRRPRRRHAPRRAAPCWTSWPPTLTRRRSPPGARRARRSRRPAGLPGGRHGEPGGASSPAPPAASARRPCWPWPPRLVGARRRPRRRRPGAALPDGHRRPTCPRWRQAGRRRRAGRSRPAPPTCATRRPGGRGGRGRAPVGRPGRGDRRGRRDRRRRSAVGGAAEQEQAVLDIDLGGVLDLRPGGRSRRCCAGREPRSGRFLAVASAAATRGLPMLAAYCAAKAGVAGLVRALAVELGRHRRDRQRGQPGLDRHRDPGRERPAVRPAPARRRSPPSSRLGRLLDPAEVAAVLAFLAGPGSSGDDRRGRAGRRRARAVTASAVTTAP